VAAVQPSADIPAFRSAPNGVTPAAMWVGYHAATGWSVTDFTTRWNAGAMIGTKRTSKLTQTMSAFGTKRTLQRL